MKRDNSIMNFTNLKESKKSNEHVSSSQLLANASPTEHHLYRHIQDNCKSCGQQLTNVNNSRKSGYEKNPRSGTRQYYTTVKVGINEREN